MLSIKEKKDFLKYIINNKLIEKEDKIIISFSGGPDSVFLYHCLKLIEDEFLIHLQLVYINHNLRDDVENDVEFVNEFSKKNNVPIHIINLDIENYAKKYKLSIELAARELRYKEIENLRKKIMHTKIATGHNMDDNVETFFFRLIRGTSLKGLKGIPSKRGSIIRPILLFQKEEILKKLDNSNEKYLIDYTNSENIYTRNKIRNTIFPLVKEINPSFNIKINNLINEINSSYSTSNDENFFKIDIENKNFSINNKEKISELEIKKILNTFFTGNNIQINRNKIDKIFEFIYTDGSKTFKLTKDKTLYKIYDKFEIRNDNENKDSNVIEELFLEYGVKRICNDYEIVLLDVNEFVKSKKEKNMIENIQENVVFLGVSLDREKDRILLRQRKDGDRILIENLGYKKLKKEFIDKKVDRWSRDLIPVIEKISQSKNEILVIGDITYSKYVKKIKKLDQIDSEQNSIIMIRRING